MKTLKKLTLAACLVGIVGQAYAWNSFESNAQKEINTYLRKNHDTRLRDDDHSVNFVIDGNIYWITFEGDANGMLYTLHRRPIKLSEKDQKAEDFNARRENAVYAVDRINATKPYKAFIQGDQVMFEMPVFAATPDDYKKIFPRVLRTMKEINVDDFKRTMNQVKVVTDSVHKHWSGYAPGRQVVPQPSDFKPSVTQTDGTVRLSSPLVSSIDRAGNLLIDYNQPIYRDKVKFMQVKVKANATKAGNYTLGLKIINPKQETMVPSKNHSSSVIMPVELPKKEKEVIFAPFGSTENGVWVPGEYTLVFTVDGKEMLRQKINVM